jgi:hypothetical protein
VLKGATIVSTRLMMVLTAVMLGMLTQPVVTQNSGEKLEITAWAVNMSNIATGANQTVDITVSRWSTPEEREELIATMLEKGGGDALLRKLQKMPSHGRMRFPSWRGPDPHNARLGWDLRYTWQTPQPDGGRRVIIAFDRYIGFWEARDRPRTMDYPFTLIELRLNKNGEGEGKMAVAAKINFDKARKVIELENYSSEPVRLQNVKAKVRT